MHEKHGYGDVHLGDTLADEVGLGHGDELRLALKPSLDVLSKTQITGGDDQGVVTFDVGIITERDLQMETL